MSGFAVILSALQVELEALLDESNQVESLALSAGAAWRVELDGRALVLARVGVGKVNTATMVGILNERFRPSAFVFTGVAGGLDPDLEIGDVVIAERSIQYDTGVIEAGGLSRYQAGHVPFFNPTSEFGFTPSEPLLRRVRDAVDGAQLNPVLGRVPRLLFGTILTGDQYLQDEVTRERLFGEFGAAAVEMEGAALAQAAALLGVDHLIIRSLSDLAGSGSAMDFNRFVGEVAANSARVVRRLLPAL